MKKIICCLYEFDHLELAMELDTENQIRNSLPTHPLQPIF
jgi:hypothetical protein